MPDHLVQDPENHRLHFVDVKYRAGGAFSIEDIKGEYSWPHALFIIVCMEHIWCLTYKQLATGKAITPTCNNLLVKRMDLGLDRELITKFGQVARNYSTGVDGETDRHNTVHIYAPQSH